MQHDHASSAREPAPLESLCQGRDGELAQLIELYRDAQRGDPSASRLVLLEGPSGIGKSRIVTELKGRVRLQGGVVLEGRCEPGRAFGPFAEIVDRALRFLDEVGVASEVDLGGLACRGGCHRLWHQHGGPDSAGRRAGAGVPYMTDDLPGATAETAVFEKRLRFFDAVASLLREVGRMRAPLVVLDHLEKADHGTRALLEFLLDGSLVHGREEPLRALFVASLRTDGARSPRALAPLLEHERARRVSVGTLDLDGVRAYVAAHPALLRILARTGGSPEAIDLLLEGEPLTPEARLELRLGVLDPAGRALIEALAVIGRPADVEELAAVAQLTPSPSSRAGFAASDLLSRSIVDGRILFWFDRDADAERAYARLAPEPKRALHARASDVCAESVHLQEAVRHAIAAGQLERAAQLAVVAAASLSARHAHTEAAALLEAFLDAAPGAGAHGAAPLGASALAAVREPLAELYRVSGDYRRALAHARALLEAHPDDAIAAHRVGQLLTAAGEHEEAAPILVHARSCARDTGVVAEVEAQLAELYYQSSEYEEAGRWGQRALRAALAAGALVVSIQARNTLGKLALAQKEPAAAEVLFEENRREAALAGLGHQEAQAHTNLAVARLVAHDLRGAEEACHTAIEVASRVCDTRERAIATENLAVIAHLGRDYGNALRYYHQAVALLKRLGNRAMLARVANNLGELYLTLGERGRARGLSEFARRVGGKLPSSVEGESLLLAGRIDAADGNVTDARDAFLRARETFARLGSVRAIEAAIELAHMALFDGNVTTARALLAELPGEMPPKHEADLALVMADLERAAGGDTRASARRAVELADRCDDPERLVLALTRHARALGDAGEIGLATRVLERAQRVEEDLTERVPEEARASWAERPARAQLTDVASRLASAWTRTRHESVPPPRALVPHRSTGVHARELDARSAAWREKYPSLVGSSPAVGSIFAMLDKVAGSDALVLIRGESGTGKELIADAIHANSARRTKPLVKVNCAALVETLLLSELFGHERGAFTGANARKKGRFELADGGTIFLDEIGDISPKTQMALLRVLQERELERVGGTQSVKVDVRIIAATHRDLEQMVRDGSFREDLYYRLRGVTMEMPPLRRRRGDLPELCEHLLGRIAHERGETVRRMSPEALECLGRHRWPGNVRELENVLRSATLFADGDVLLPQDFAAFSESFAAEEPEPVSVDVAGVTTGAPPLESLMYARVRDGETSLLEMKKVLERECIVRALEETDGNITRAADLLGMKRPRLSQLVKQYGLSKQAGG